MTPVRPPRPARRQRGASILPSVGPYSGLTGIAATPLSLPPGGSLADREQRFEVVSRVGGEGDHRLRAHDAREAADLAGDDVGELLVMRHPDDRDEIPLAGHGVG